MKSQNLTQSDFDPCLFVRVQQQGRLYIIICVDDVIIAATHINLINQFKDAFARKFKIKDMGNLNWFLGIQFNLSDSVISLNQFLYTNTIINRFNKAKEFII